MQHHLVLPGRLQPPHNDHLELICRAIELATRTQPVAVALLVAAPEHGPPRDAFDEEARRHHEPARCPFSFWERKRMLEAALDPAHLARVDIVPLPRPEQAWEWVSAVFPGRRTWIVPDSGEAFDDEKARFFRSRGDAVHRVALPPTTDGRLVRALISARDPRLAQHVPPAVRDLIETWRDDR